MTASIRGSEVSAKPILRQVYFTPILPEAELNPTAFTTLALIRSRDARFFSVR